MTDVLPTDMFSFFKMSGTCNLTLGMIILMNVKGCVMCKFMDLNVASDLPVTP
jgi:hypothetical protein